MSNKLNIEFGIMSVAIIVTGITSIFIKNNKENNKKYYKKMQNVLIKESGLDSDLYNRKIDSKTIKLFCKIAKMNKIGLEQEIDKDLFDKLYIQLIEYQINNAHKKKIINFNVIDIIKNKNKTENSIDEIISK